MDIQILRNCRIGGVDYSSGIYTSALNNSLSNAASLVAYGVAIDLTAKFPSLPATYATDSGGNVTGLALSNGGVSPMTPYYGQVGNKSRIPSALYAAGTATQCRNREYVRAFSPLMTGKWQIVIANFYLYAGTVSGGYGEIPTGSSMTVNAAIEYPRGTLAAVVTFNGSATGTIASGQLGTSDFISCNIPQGAEFGIHLFKQCAGGIPYTNGCSGQLEGTGSFDCLLTATSGMTNTTTNFSASTTGLVYGNSSGVSAVLGWTNKPSVFGLGDSHWMFSADYAALLGQPGGLGNDGDYDGAIGFLERALVRSVPTINAGRAGETAGNMATGYSGAVTNSVYNANRLILASYCSHVFGALGTNDVIAGSTSSSIAGYLNTLQSLYSKPTFWATIPPICTSSDNFTVYANQTKSVNDSVRQTINDGLRAGGVISGVNINMAGVLDVSGPLERGRTGKWITYKNGRVVSDGVMSSVTNTTTLTSATANFTQEDIGQVIIVAGAGPASGANQTVIRDVTNSTTAILGNAASTTVSAASTSIGCFYATGDGTHARYFGLSLVSQAKAITADLLR